MRKATLMVLGILGLSLLLCGSDEVLAQTDTSAFPPGSPGSDATDSRLQGTPSIDVDAGTGGAGASPAELQQTVLQLQGEVARLQQELAQARQQLANVTANTGAGGAGQAGMAPTAAPTGTSAGQSTPASGGQVGTSPGTAQPEAQAGGTDSSSLAVVHAIYRGKVRSVSSRELVLEDDRGQPFTVELGAQTRFISKGQRISPQQLKRGTRVRATVDMLSGHNQAMEVATLPER